MDRGIGKRIGIARKKRGLTLEELGLSAMVSKQTIFKYENGTITNIPSDKISRISKALGVSPAYLMGWEDIQGNKIPPEYWLDSYVDSIIEERKEKFPDRNPITGERVVTSKDDSLIQIPIEYKKLVPILGYIAAGQPITAITEIEYYQPVLDENIDYGLRVKGDSMSMTIRADSIIFVDQDADIKNGDIVVAIIDGEDATIKRYYKQGNTIILRPDNPNYTEHEYSTKEVEIRGKVVGEYKTF